MKNYNCPIFEQMCKYKSILPIDINSYDVKYCIEWLEQNQLPHKLLLEDYLETIYDIAGMICDGVPLVTGAHKLESNIKEFWKRNKNWYDFYNPHTDDMQRRFDDNLNNIENKIIEDFNVVINSNIFTRSNLAISIIYDLQKQFNPNKYKQNIYEIIPHNLNINAMCFLYYLSNQLVLLSHDVIYAINENISKFKDNTIKIVKDVIQPLSWTLELVCESIMDNGIIIDILKSNKNLLLNNSDRNKFKQKWYSRRYNMFDNSYERFSIYFLNIYDMLSYYKSAYYNILNELEKQIQNIYKACCKKSLTRDKIPVWNNTDRCIDIYEILSNWLEECLEFDLIRNHYKIGKLLLNKSINKEIINQCKECFSDQLKDFKIFVSNKINNYDENSKKIVNQVKNQIMKIQESAIEKIDSVTL